MTLPRLLASRRRRRLLGRLVAAGLAEAGLAVAAAIVVVRGYEGWIDAGHDGGLSAAGSSLVWPIGLVAIALVLWALRGWQQDQAERLAQDYVKRVRLRLFKAVTGAGSAARPVRAGGPHMVRFASDLTAVRLWIAQGVGRVAVAGIAAAGGIALLPALDVTIGSAAAVVLIVPIAFSLLLGQGFRRHADRARRARNRVAANLGDKVMGVAVVRAFRHGRREARRLARQSDVLAAAMIARSRVAGWLRALPDLALPLATAGVLALGPAGLAAGSVDIGALLAIATVLGLLGRPLSDLTRALEFWHGFQVARGRIEPALAVSMSERRQVQHLAQSVRPARVVFDGLCVGVMVRNLSATAEPATLTAIVGPNGAGKSAILGVIGGIARPTAGRVLVDDRDLERLPDGERRRLVGFASPDLPLQRGSVRRNLRYRVPKATGAEVEQVLEDLGLDHMPAVTSSGRGGRLDDGGRNLSTGERHALGLARAMIGGPPVLVLDDPTRDLDPATRAHLQSLLAKRTATILAATQDLALVRAADVVWYVEAGQLLERGAPRDLLSTDSRTARHFGVAPANQRNLVRLPS